METQEYHVEGPVTIVLTTTAIDIDEELHEPLPDPHASTRAREQTERIHALQREARTARRHPAPPRSARTCCDVTAERAAPAQARARSSTPSPSELTFTSERTRTRRDHEKYLDAHRRDRAAAPAPARARHAHRRRPRSRHAARHPRRHRGRQPDRARRSSAAASTNCRRRPAACWKPSRRWSASA